MTTKTWHLLTRRAALLGVGFGVSGCFGLYGDDPFEEIHYITDTEGSSSGSIGSTAATGSTESTAASGSEATGEASGSTVDVSSTSGASSAGESETSDDTTGAPLGPPEIVEFGLTPDPITINGAIAVTVEATLAEGVRMELEGGAVVELAAGERGVFEGSIPALSGLWNGSHEATLAPWRSGIDGEAVVASYTIALPKPGSQGFWEAGDLVGEGLVKALGVLPSGQVVEFGQRWVNGSGRCYLRRRDKGGSWSQSDVLDVLPGSVCSPVDMKIDAKGSIVMLALRTGKNGNEWWLGELGSWGTIPKNRGLGAIGEAGLAVAVAKDGTIAVCGTRPTGEIDVQDAAAWIFRKDQAGEAWGVDYQAKDDPHKFTETVRDCAFAGTTLVMAGEVKGLHDGDNEPKRDRHLLVELDLEAKAHAFKVGGIEGGVQSGAKVLVIDDQGRYVTAGFVCGDACSPVATLRVHDPKGGPGWYAPIGEMKSLAYGPHDLAWSPAGYAVVASGGAKGDESTFWVRAFAPGSGTPLWTFSRKDNQLFHMAFAVAIGAFGEVYAGGLGANNYPAVAYIAG